MLSPEQLAHCADDIINLYSQLEEEIVRDVYKRQVKDRLSRLFPTYKGGNVVERPERLKKVIKDTDNIPTDYEFTQAVEDILTYYMNEKRCV